jgi:twinkle protein
MNIVSRSQCPICASKGNDNKGDNRIEYEDGHSFCYSCGSLNDGKGMKQEMSIFRELEPVELESRGIGYETIARYGVGLDTNDVLCFPYYHEGSIVAYKERHFPERDFKWVGDASKAWLFGSHVCSNASTLIICEGETDTLAVAEALQTQRKAICVVGIAKGASSAERAIKTHLEWIRKFKKIIVLFDNDDAGQQAVQSVVKVLPPGRTHTAHLPSGTKDANELLLEDIEALRNVITNAVAVTPTSVVDSSRLVLDSLDFFFNREAMLGISTGSTGLDWLIGGWGEGTVITLVGDTGVGKTTFATQLAQWASSEKHPVFWIGLEMTPRQQLLKLTEFSLKKPFVSKPFEFEVLPDELRQGLQDVASKVRFYDHYGTMSKEALIDAIEVAADAYDCKLIVLDHISAAAGADWKELDSMIAALKGVALQKNISILVLAHVTIEKREDKDGATRLKLGHIRGSRSIAQYSDAVLGIERDRKTSATSVRTLKLHRTVSQYGEVLFELSGGEYIEVAILDAEGNVTEPPKSVTFNKHSKTHITIEVQPHDDTTKTERHQEDNSQKTKTKRLREASTPRGTTTELRELPDTVQHIDNIHTGLHITEQQREDGEDSGLHQEERVTIEVSAFTTSDVHRDKGIPKASRQRATVKVSRPMGKPDKGSAAVPEWEFNSL